MSESWKNTIYNDDCFNVMKDIPDGSIDMILCDLPYGTTSCKWDIILPFDLLWEQYHRIIKDNGAIVLFGSEPFSSALRMSNINMFRYDWIWQKNSSGGFATANKMPMKRHEVISVFYKKLPIYNPQFKEYSTSTKKRFGQNGKINRKKQVENSTNQIHGGLSLEGNEIDVKRGAFPTTCLFFDNLPNSNQTRLHPTQKPVALLEYLIKTYTNENETVLDNTAGSFSTAIACINTDRNYIMIEKDKEYFDIGAERIATHTKEIIRQKNKKKLF
jgi:site-specific DNA-methyltransferase (adenine-specific)